MLGDGDGDGSGLGPVARVCQHRGPPAAPRTPSHHMRISRRRASSRPPWWVTRASRRETCPANAVRLAVRGWPLGRHRAAGQARRPQRGSRRHRPTAGDTERDERAPRRPPQRPGAGGQPAPAGPEPRRQHHLSAALPPVCAPAARPWWSWPLLGRRSAAFPDPRRALLIAWPAPSCNQPPRGGVLTGQEVTVTPQAGEEFLQSTLVHLDAVHALDPAAGARARRGPRPGDVAQGVRRLDRHAAPRPAGLAGDDLPQHRPLVVSPGRRPTRAADQRPGCDPGAADPVADASAGSVPRRCTRRCGRCRRSSGSPSR